MRIAPLWRALSCAAALIGLQAAAQAGVGLDVAQDLMRRSGLWEQMGSVAPQFDAALSASFARLAKPIPADAQERMRRAVQSAYAPERLRAVAAASLARELDPKMVADLLAWYGSPLGQAVRQLEQAQSGSVEEPAARLRKGADLYRAAAPMRQALLQRTTAVTHAAEATTSVLVESTLALRLGMLKVEPDEPGPSVDELRRSLEEKRPALTQRYAGMMTADFALMYAKLQDGELEAYDRFLESDSGARFNTLALAALRDAMVEAAREYGGALPGAKAAAHL